MRKGENGVREVDEGWRSYENWGSKGVVAGIEWRAGRECLHFRNECCERAPALNSVIGLDAAQRHLEDKLPATEQN